MNRNLSNKAIIFDFDYTLADSSIGIIKSINYALQKLGFSPVSDYEAKKTIGLSLSETFYTLVGRNNDDGVDEFIQHFIEKANEVVVLNTVLFPNVLEVFNQLHEDGFHIGIVSTKFRYRIEAILNRENLLNLVDIIVGGENVSRHKPDPEGIFKAMKELNTTSINTIYVGDSITDAKAAKNANIPFIAMLSGVTPTKEFEEFKLIGIYKNLKEMIKALR